MVLESDFSALPLSLGIYGASVLLHVCIPSRKTDGYACDADGKTLKYRHNGIYVLVTIVAAFLCLEYSGYRVLVLSDHFWGLVIFCNVLGIVASVLLYLTPTSAALADKRRRCNTVDSRASGLPSVEELADYEGRGLWMHFYCGLEWNPRLFGGYLDIKMWLYLAGAVMLQLLLCSQLMSVHRSRAQTLGVDLPPSNAMLTYFCCFTWFVFEYVWHEHVHTFTYDIFCERVGFKLAWGCLAFYPNFYAIGGWCMVSNPHADISRITAAACVALFFSGWFLTRGANMQKFALKTKKDATHFRFLFFLPEVPQTVLAGSNGRLLCSGWWGVARHVNYFGEIVQAVALSLPGVLATGSLQPFLYPLYYVALFLPRQADDDQVCQLKYGTDVWSSYCQQVPYRIIPGVW